MLYNDVKATLINKEVEELDEPETTYHFEVEDDHPYYIVNNGILVHSECTGSYEIEFDD